MLEWAMCRSVDYFFFVAILTPLTLSHSVGPGWNQNQWVSFPNGYGTASSPPGNAQSFQWTSAPRNAFTNCPGGQTGNYICPQPLMIRGNQEPYSGYGVPGGFNPLFLGSSNGFYIPIGYDSTWLVRCTITINILWNNYRTNKNQYWLMFINRGSGWEQVRERKTHIH